MRRVVFGLLVIVLLVSACGRETPAPAGPTEGAEATTMPVQVSTSPPRVQAPEGERAVVRFAINDFEQPMYRDLIDAFEEENPDLHIEVVSVNDVLGLGPIGQIEVPDDAEQRLVEAADVINMGISRTGVQQGLVHDLTPFIEGDAGFQPGDFASGALQAYQWNGGTWALPTTLTYRLVFFDKDAFDEARVPYPEADWTWDDLLVKAQALTVREGDNVTRWGFVPNGPAYRLIESRVGSLVDYGAEPPMPRYGDTDVVDAVRWYTNLYLEHKVMPYSTEGEEEGDALVTNEQLLVDGGQAAMWTDQHLMWWIRSQQANIGVMPFPGDGGPGSTPASAGGMVMSAGTRQPQAAWRWLDFASRHSLSSMTMGIKFLPARRSAAEGGGFWEGLDKEFATALRLATEQGRVVGEVVAYDAFEEALDAILQGERTPEEAMAAAQAQAEAQLQEEAVAQAGATPVPTFVVAPPEKETPVSDEAVNIVFVPGLGSLNLDPFRDLAEQFHEKHPDIVVDVRMADFVSGTPTLWAMAEGADCFEWYPGFQDTQNREAILSLAPFVDADISFAIDDYFGQVLEPFRWQGQLMGLPADITPFVIEYNKDLFDAARVDYPAPGWTWDEFLGIAVDLTEGEEEETKQYGFVAEFYELNDLLLITERLGARLIDESADPPAFTFNDPATVEAMRWYVGLTTEHEVKPVYVTDLKELLSSTSAMIERESLITGGRAAMWTGSATAAAVFGERSDLNAGTAPLPVRADGSGVGAPLTSSGYFISAQTENRQACWQWITFLNNQPAAVQGLPARRSVAESDAFRQRVGVERAEAYLASIGDSDKPSAFQILNDEEWLGGAIYWYGQAFGQVIDGEATVEEALDTAQQLADDYRACVIAGNDFDQAAWQACVQEIDPSLPGLLFAAGQ